MKKFVVGLLIGVGVAFAFSAQAEEIKSFIGAKIEGQFPVTVDGETIETPSIVVEGTSYLPVRTLAEHAGYDVSFDPKNGISLTSQNEEVQIQAEIVEEVVTIETNNTAEIERRLKEIDHSIQMIQDRHMKMLDFAINDPLTDEAGKQEALQKKADLEATLSQLEAEKAELEAQLSSAS